MMTLRARRPRSESREAAQEFRYKRVTSTYERRRGSRWTVSVAVTSGVTVGLEILRDGAAAAAVTVAPGPPAAQ